MRLRYARWQGLVAAAAGVAFVVATHWRYPGVAGGIILLVVVVLKSVEGLFRRLAGRDSNPGSRSRSS